MPKQRIPAAPGHLRVPGRRLWRQVLDVWDLGGHERELLRLAAEALDRAEEAREAIAGDGAYLRDFRGTLKPHPALDVEHRSRLTVERLLRGLRLPAEVE